MWTKVKSLTLSRILVIAMFILLIAGLVFIPYISKWFECISTGKGFFEGSIFVPVCILLYVSDVFALTAVSALYILLRNIASDKVFIPTNTKCLRIISWCCVMAGITYIVFSPWRYEFLFAAFFAEFLGLILRVLKNVFEEAVEIKSENDYTV
ncbi:MAG: DUF2975 domain-containing protein [Oscillospiraceae bacterium]|nr:DUF2975 domain-containing protein [Oscillospiraceae bacterium]